MFRHDPDATRYGRRALAMAGSQRETIEGGACIAAPVRAPACAPLAAGALLLGLLLLISP
jgi:hypothetical protein